MESTTRGQYSDRTHFLLELLQNAVDAQATKVSFDLEDGQLEFRHDGRDFSPLDVAGVCGMGEGTKSDELTAIGKFGIGFKSVHAYTVSPQIHCPGSSEHFEIREFVEPHAIDPRDPGNGWSTLIVLPFDRYESDTKDAIFEIAGGLSALQPRTILFLERLRTLEWRTFRGDSATLLREERQDGAARRVRLLQDGLVGDRDEEWIIYQAPVSIISGAEPNRVEVAFLVSGSDSGTARVTYADDSELVVFFPTSKESHLGVLIQAPFDVTPARDNLRENSQVNTWLATAAGVASWRLCSTFAPEACWISPRLSVFRLTTNFPDGALLRPVYDAVRYALGRSPLVPTNDGRHVPASEVRYADGAALRELFSPSQLGLLLDMDHDVAWIASEMTPDRTPLLYDYFAGRSAVSWKATSGVAALVPRFNVDFDAVLSRLSPEFLEAQSDEWMIRLYRALGERGNARRVAERAILRSEDGTHVAAVDANGDPNIYLPREDESAFLTVNRTIAGDAEALKIPHRAGPHRARCRR